MLRSEESAESIVVVSESVSNRRRVTRPVKSAVQPVRSKARTKEEEATGGGL